MNGPTYIWLCHKCGKSNQAHTDNCSFCGFQSNASAYEIEAALNQSQTSKVEQTIKLSSAKKVVGILGVAIAGMGAFMGKFGLSVDTNIIGLILMGVGVLTLCSIGIIGNKNAA